MAVLKCKYCGGSVSPFPDNALGTCSSCGATMTLPKNTDKQRAAANNAGNYMRRAGKFDKALAIYQEILREDSTDAEASWCSALCRFGIQYEPDEKSGVYLPVCHRPEAGNFLEAGEYLAALANSSGAVQMQYEKEAARIAAPQPEIPTVQEDPEILLKQGFWHLEKESWAAADRCFIQVTAAEPENAMAHLGRLLAQMQCRSPKELPQCSTPIDTSEHYRNALEYADESLQKFLSSIAHKLQRQSQIARVDEYYSSAVAAMEKAEKAEDFRAAAQMFQKLAKYKDAEERAQQCTKQAEKILKDDIYWAALSLKKNARTVNALKAAANEFSRIPGWRDANAQAADCRERIAASNSAASVPDVHYSRWKSIVKLMFALMILGIVVFLAVTRYFIPQGKYRAAEAMLAANEKEDAIAAFQALGSFRDSPARADEIQRKWYWEAEGLLQAGDTRRAAAIFGGLKDYEDARERSAELWSGIVQPELISAGGWYTVGLKSDGTVESVGADHEKQCSTGSWLNITSVSSGWAHTVGLRSDGTVVAVGYNGDGRGDTAQWQDIVAIAAGQWHTVGLRSNGKVWAIGCDKDGRTDLSSWRDVIAVSAGRHHTLGLRADGTVLAAGENHAEQCSLESWNNLIAVSAGGAHSLGLRKDGTVIAAGENVEGQCNVESWSDIVAIAAGYYHTVGLKADGTVVAVGLNEDGQCEVSKWTDIVAISAGGWHTVGLKADGTVVAVGRNVDDQCNTDEWSAMMIPQ